MKFFIYKKYKIPFQQKKNKLSLQLPIYLLQTSGLPLYCPFIILFKIKKYFYTISGAI